MNFDTIYVDFHYFRYQELNQCYQTVFDATVASGGGAAFFQTAVQTCYGQVAYVYRDATSVYNVSPPLLS